ncbi:MAG: hypothetical protein HOP36_03420 [Methyloglobulus sp.]|nr:hypothetical protein [Methyloglobulus sp.]
MADLRVFFDRSIPLEDGTYEDGGGFWLTVSAWGHRAESAVKLLSKGMRKKRGQPAHVAALD